MVASAKMMNARIFLVIWMAGAVALHAESFEEAAITEAGANYQKNCMSCHQPPDLRFATDRAWVGQIRETA